MTWSLWMRWNGPMPKDRISFSITSLIPAPTIMLPFHVNIDPIPRPYPNSWSKTGLTGQDLQRWSSMIAPGNSAVKNLPGFCKDMIFEVVRSLPKPIGSLAAVKDMELYSRRCWISGKFNIPSVHFQISKWPFPKMWLPRIACPDTGDTALKY